MPCPLSRLLLFVLPPLTGLTFLLAGSGKVEEKPLPKRPLTPEQSRQLYRLPPGVRLELVASEPEIESPVAMSFDEDGKLWVVEMRDYPNGPAPGEAPLGRIKVLEDRDGDGRYEHATLFADKILFCNGLLRWRDGILVTAAPNILYLRDTNGDGKADTREILYEGFAAENPQLRVSHPTLGLDGWVYVANGLRGGKVARHDGKGEPIDLRGRDFRFDLLGGREEAISGMGQFGNTFDAWGRRFVCDNRHHLRLVALEDRYLRRGSALAAPAVLEDISEMENAAAGGCKVFPLSRNWTTSNLHAGQFTAACGVFIYQGDLLGPAFQGSGLTCDPTGNLVHQELIRPHGATFRSKPPREGEEMLATPDDWGRPVFLSDGPDGALYVVDMYRAVIEHPQFMPPELKDRPDLVLGRDRGRIWRIVPEGHKGSPPRPRLGQASSAELARLLGHPGGWWRSTAHRLLLERQDRGAIDVLRPLCEKGDSAQARARAAWLLQGMGALDEKLLLGLLEDREPRVREQAILLAELRLKSSAKLAARLIALAGDDDARVRFQLALTLGEISGEDKYPALAAIALRDADDSWTRLAVASSAENRAGHLLALLLRPPHSLASRREAGRTALVRELSQLTGAQRDPAQTAELLGALAALPEKERLSWHLPAVEALADALARRGTRLDAFLKALPPEHAAAVAGVDRLMEKAGRLAVDRGALLAERLSAIRLLSHAGWDVAGAALEKLFLEDPGTEVRAAAVQALASHRREEIPALLLRTWKSLTPALRREVADGLLRRPEWVQKLLDEVEAGRIRPTDIDAVRARRLTSHGTTAIRTRAQKLLQQTLPADRKEVLARYQAALAREGDIRKGRDVFQKNCAACHRVAGVGADVGPVISDTRTKTAAMLLTDILSPNQAIDNNYVNYLVVTADGRSLTGIITAETASSITLKQAENKTETILRTDVEEIISTGVSLMPDGLEKSVSIEDMANLLAFLKSWRYLEGDVPGLGKTAP